MSYYHLNGCKHFQRTNKRTRRMQYAYYGERQTKCTQNESSGWGKSRKKKKKSSIELATIASIEIIVCFFFA